MPLPHPTGSLSISLLISTLSSYILFQYKYIVTIFANVKIETKSKTFETFPSKNFLLKNISGSRGKQERKSHRQLERKRTIRIYFLFDISLKYLFMTLGILLETCQLITFLYIVPYIPTK